MTKMREISWPEEFNDLKCDYCHNSFIYLFQQRIEESLVCGICYEYMETTVMTPCAHNFCSLCIRKYLHYKAQCPSCFHVFYEKDLYTNRAMDSIITHYIKVRETLINLIENRVVYNTVVQQKEESESTTPARPGRSQIPKSPKMPEMKPCEPKTPTATSAFFASTSKCNALSPSTSRSPKVVPSIAKIFNTPKRKEVLTAPPSSSAKSVSCPVCRVDISENHINVHLDACLKRETGQKVVKERPVAPKRPPLPKLVLRVMKDAELRKKMKELGLPTNGDRRALETRFTRYSTIYNAECDKLEPRPIPDLLRQCEMEEKQERKMDCFLVSTTTSTRLLIEKNAKEEKIEEAQKMYREANKSSFDKLIEEVRNRKKLEMEKKKSELGIADQSTPSAEPSTSNHVPEENQGNEEKSSINPSAEIFIDTDSEEDCPLQHYVNVNDSSPSTSTSGSPIKRIQTLANASIKSKGSISPQKIFNNPYEESTDESTDENIESSPQVNEKSNRKRARLSIKSIATSEPMNDRESQAKDLCNSIIKDFSFEGFSDDSSSEFSIKPCNGESKKLTNTKCNLLEQPQLQKKMQFSSDTKVPEKQPNRTVLGDVLNNTSDDILFDQLDESSGFIDTSITVPKEILQKSTNEMPNYVEPENSTNENSQPTESLVRRPVRKRNRPTRYAENHVTNGDQPSSGESRETNSPESLTNFTTTDISLKRRRGRSKAKTIDPNADDLQNPPKRPVRRRQATSDLN